MRNKAASKTLYSISQSAYVDYNQALLYLQTSTHARIHARYSVHLFKQGTICVTDLTILAVSAIQS